MHEGTGSADASAEELITAMEQVIRHLRQSAVAGGLSATASSVIGRLGREGPRRLTDLARAEGGSQPNMTQLVTRMERAGLVRRAPDRTDGRGVLVAATPAGLELARRRRAERAHALSLLVAGLSGPDLRAVRAALPALARAVRERADGT